MVQNPRGRWELMNHSIRFIPFVRPMVWGGRRLGDVMGKPLEGEGPWGESWEVADHAVHVSTIASGPLAGQSLRDLVQKQPEALLGPAARSAPTFPWLFKFLDACDWLSVQVHPDAEAVQTLWP